jgi:hypothetical protein
MAEAASLAFAALVTDRMNLTNINFLSDYEQLVHFLNAPDQSNSPDWKIKHLTQMFSNLTSTRESRIFKISRRLNIIADALAHQASSDSVSHNIHLESICSYEHHFLQCTVLQALQYVEPNDVTLL